MPLAIAILTSITLVMTYVSLLRAEPEPNPWYFSAEEIEAAYRYQENFGKGLKRPLRATSCIWGADDFSASLYGEHHRLPCRFVTETLRHLKEILLAGAARYIFPLDLNHAHLAIPRTSWREKYRDLPSEQILPALIRDPELVALYHSAEHLKVESKGGRVNPALRQWQSKRNILGFFDGRPIKILPPHPEGNGVSIPTKYWSYGGVEFLANRGAALAILLEDRVLAVDIRLDAGSDNPNLLTGNLAANP